MEPARRRLVAKGSGSPLFDVSPCSQWGLLLGAMALFWACSSPPPAPGAHTDDNVVTATDDGGATDDLTPPPQLLRWAVPERLSQATPEAQQAVVSLGHHQVVINNAGDALVTWIRSNLGRPDEFMAASFSGGRWAAPQVITELGRYDSPGTNGPGPVLALNDAGEGLVVWRQEHPLGSSRWALLSRRYIGGEWESSRLIADGEQERDAYGRSQVSGMPLYYDIVLGQTGDAVIVWYRYLASASGCCSGPHCRCDELWTARSTGGGWGNPNRLSGPWPETSQGVDVDCGGGRENHLRLAPAGSGQTLVVFAQQSCSETPGGVYAGRLNAGQWEEAPVVLDQRTSGKLDYRDPQLFADGQGNAVLAWQQWPERSLRISRYGQGAGWTAPNPWVAAGSSSPPNTLHAYYFDMAVLGDRLAAGWQTGGLGTLETPQLWFAETHGIESFGSPKQLEGSQMALRPQVGLDSLGDLTVAWASLEQRSDSDPGRPVVWAARRVSGQWTQPQRLSRVPLTMTVRIGPQDGPSLAVSPSGRAVVVWTDFDDGPERSLWATHLTSSATDDNPH